MAPKFRQEEGYVFKIYSNEEERKHIHVVKAETEAKFWPAPKVEFADNYGLKGQQISNITPSLETSGAE